jgi:hypothetical protein
MKKIAVFVVAVAVLLAGTAFAEDGFKAYVGYSVGYENNKVYSYESGVLQPTVTVSGLSHGPNVDLRYEGDFLVRGTFDYIMGASNKLNPGDGTAKQNYDMYNWTAEGDVGYRIYKANNISIYPYIGFGYKEYKFTKSSDHSSWHKFDTPYGVAGAFVKYEQPLWSVGLDVAGLVPFAGKFKDSSPDNADTNVGWGARVQVPITYTIIPKKTSGIGILVFIAPYFEYLDSLKSDAFKADTTTKRKMVNYSVGGKAGVGFAF